MASCSFDVKPVAGVRADSGSATSESWQPAAVSRRGRIISQQMSDAGLDGSAAPERSGIMVSSSDAGKRGREVDAGRTLVDADQPAQQAPQLDAGPGAANTGGSSAPTGAPPATAPAMLNQCMPGIYEGTFEGPVTFAVGSLNSVSGTVRAELKRDDPAGNALHVQNGMMIGKDNAGVGMHSGWTGTVNCGTKQLENGRHESGAWDNGSTFTGTLEGTYTVNPYAMSGTWKVQSEQIPLAGGNGTWHMTLQNAPRP